MSDNILLNLGSGGKTVKTLDIGGFQHEQVLMEFSDGIGGATLVSATNPLPTTESPATTIYNGQKTVTTAGTQVVLAASQAVKSVTVKALSTNTGLIFVGATGVSSSNGYVLSARESISLDISNLATVFINSSLDGEGVSYLGIN